MTVTKQEVEVIADLDKCNPDNIKAGDIRWMPNGLGVIWVQCPANTQPIELRLLEKSK